MKYYINRMSSESYKIIEKHGYKKYKGSKQGHPDLQKMIRSQIEQMLRIKFNLATMDPLPTHCFICGDTLIDGNLIRALPVNNIYCEFCFIVQNKM